MKINWKVRFKNKTWLLSFIALVLTFLYNVLSMFDIVPTVTQQEIMDAVTAILTILASVGVIIDPTTAGVSDSEKALTYEEPKK